MRVVLVLSVCTGLVGGCGGGESNVGGGPPQGSDGTRELPDGFVAQGCASHGDCDDGDPCTIDQCAAATHACDHTVVKCDSPAINNDCQKGVCDPTSGVCTGLSINEAGACTDVNNGSPGSCAIGVCMATPQCKRNFLSLNCSSFNKSTSASTLGTGTLDSYRCPGATNLTGPEQAYPFKVATDRDITLSLTNTSVDFDLLVLKGQFCTGVAECVASATTIGTGNETLTFHALANTEYTVVIDGRNGVKGSFTLDISCLGGTCKPIKTLACNMSMMGTTGSAASTNVVPSYSCQAMESGPEDTYQLTQSSTTNYQMTLSGLTQDLDLFVLYDTGGECDPSSCKAYSANPGTANETASFTAYGSTTYDLVVDSKGAGGPYLLQVDCPPSCNSDSYLDCFIPSDARRNDDPSRSRKIVDHWACDPNTTGPEVTYRFDPTTSGQYTFTLDGLSADLDLIVVEGTFSACDPASACVASSVTAGTASESVTFMADAGKSYYIAVDGKAGAVSSYNLRLKSKQCPGVSCYNSANTLGCSYLEDTRKNDDAIHSKKVIDAWACDANTTGAEVVYKFTPTVNGMYTVALDGLTADLDLIVVSNASSFVCDANAACVASSVSSGTTSESVTFMATTSNTYFVAVDGKNGAVGSYHVKLSSPSCPAPVCKAATATLSCASPSTTSRNDAVGSTNDVAAWACDTNTTGAENAHRFTPPVAGMYTVEMIGLHADLDLIVLEGTGAGTSVCSPTAACVAQSTHSGTVDEKVTFLGDPMKSYFIVADGKSGVSSQYTIAITDGCP